MFKHLLALVSLFLFVGCEKEQLDQETSWIKHYRKGGLNTEGVSVKEFENGDLVWVGHTLFEPVGSSCLVVRTNERGDVLWSRDFKLGSRNDMVGRDVIIEKDHSIVIATQMSASNGSDIGILKLTGQGDTVWSKQFFIDGPQYVNSIIKHDDSYLLCGKSNSRELLVIKTNLDGDSIWTSRYAESEKYYEAQSLIETDDGGYIVCGGVFDQNGGANQRNIIAAKITSFGNLEWLYDYGGGRGQDCGWKIRKLDSSNFIVAAGGKLLKLNGNGGQTYVKVMEDNIYDVIPLGKDYIVLNKGSVTRFDSIGLTKKQIDLPNLISGNSFTLTNNRDITVVGSHLDFNLSKWNAVLMRYELE